VLSLTLYLPVAPVVTRREADVLARVMDRLTNAEIATELCVSERTVESHVSSLLRKFGATNRRALVELMHALATQAAPPQCTRRRSDRFGAWRLRHG
jgi:DNA-binding CsgD family transcriptional regulator